MAYRPRIIFEVLRKGNAKDAVKIPIFQLTTDSVVGITADWFSAQVINNNHEYDWIFNDIESHEVKIYQFLSNLPPTATDQEVSQEASGHCILHGWLGPVSKTLGSEVKNIMSIKGGDVCYMLNKRHPGDMLKRSTDIEMMRTQTKYNKIGNPEKFRKDSNPVKAGPPWQILKEILKVDNTGKPLPNSRDNIYVYASDSFKNDTTIISGIVNQDQYSPDLQTDADKAANNKKLYQSNNQSVLEIIDDVCTKSGYEATTMPGTKSIWIYKLQDEYDKANKKPSEFDKLLSKSGSDRIADWNENIILYAGDAPEGTSQLRKCMYCKITKYPGYEDGLELNMIHWDWTKSNASGTIGNDFLSSTALFEGNEQGNTFASVTKIYEPIPQAALDRKVVRALSRIESNRITGYIGLPGGDTSIMPGKTFTLKGAGFYSGIMPGKEKNPHSYLANNIYYITSVKRNYSSGGYTTSISFRLRDLIQYNDLNKHKQFPYTTCYVTRKVK